MAENLSHFPHGSDWSQIASTVNLLCEQLSRVASREEGRIEYESHLKLVRQIRRWRRARSNSLGGDLFGEPAWDMLLELYALALEQQKVSVSSICLTSGVPPTTALRWLEKLQQSGFVEREDDPLDGRRTWIRLSRWGLARMREYFETVRASR